ncbi:hypothetical protein ACIOC1_00435 [Streptomyces sp. NPDC088197]|uniref:hypothetical protein n=1 Tax=Streptomyces sp. NPDC088197 TaxID=3365840 RepID=UPI0038039C17
MAANLITPFDIDTLTYDGGKLRRAALMTVMHNGGTLTGRSGVRPGDSGLTVTLSGTTINVSAGVASVFWPARGVYRAGLESSATSTPSTLTAAHATLTRVDLVYLRIFDSAVDSSGLYGGDIIYLAGTPGAGVAPAPPAPQIWMPLATVTVPPVGGGAASVSTTVRPVTVAPGGILPAQTSTPPSPYSGQAWHDGTDLKLWNGTSVDTYAKVKSVPWIDLNTASGLASGYTTPQGNLQKCQFRMITVDGTQRVEWRGSISCTADVVGQSTFATLPTPYAAYRPSVLRTIGATRNFTAASSGATRIEITTTGAMSVFGAPAPAQTSWFCLDNQHYDI